MKRITHLGNIGSMILLCAAYNPIPAVAVGEPTKHLMITEVSPEAADTGTKEYIYLYNPNVIDIEVTGWTIQYRSASHKSEDTTGWATKAVLGCATAKAADCETLNETTVKAGEGLRLSSFEMEKGVLPLSSGMATSGGQVRLVDPGRGASTEVVVQDMVGYGTAVDFEGQKPAVAPKAGRSIVRIQDGLGAFVDTDRNDVDFVLSPDEDTSSHPGGASTNNNDVPGQGAGERLYREAEITEVMPDPASPQLDSADEFIELYNPYGEALDLSGYILKTGTTWTHKYTIKDVIIEPYDYVVLTSAQTHLSLSNTGTGVRLYDSVERLLYESPGNSWVRDGSGQWVWTTKPTPGDQNAIEAPPVSASKASSSITKKPSTKTASSNKKASTPKTAPVVKGVATTASEPGGTSSQGNQIGLWVLGGAVVLGLGYALFEYRQDIGSFVRRRWEAMSGLGRSK